jgi:glycolate oxidase
MDSDWIVEELALIVGEDYVTNELYERRLYDHDLAPLPTEVGIIFKTLPDMVIIPKTTAEMEKVIKFSYENNIPVVPRGSASWGYGGTIPTQGGLVISSVRLNEIEIDEATKTASVGAGVRWQALLTKLEGNGFTFPVYPSSAPSGTIAGWLATGGLGIGSLKYGPVMDHVTELTVVTPKGEKRILTHQDDDFDIYFNSEGTLGFITEAKLSLMPRPEKIHPVLVGFKDYTDAGQVIEKSSSKKILPFMIDIQDSEYLQIRRSIGMHQPDSPILCIFVYEGGEDEVDKSVQELLAIVAEAEGTVYSDEEAWTDWEERFNSMNIKKAGPTLLAGEISYPINRIKEVLNGLKRIKKKHDLRLGVKTYVVSPDTVLMLPMFLADERNRWKYMSMLPVINEITEVGLKEGGGPYGIGIWNSFYLKRHIGPEKTRKLKETKKKHDAKGIMNPGKLYDVKIRYGIPLPEPLYRFGIGMLWILRYF